MIVKCFDDFMFEVILLRCTYSTDWGVFMLCCDAGIASHVAADVDNVILSWVLSSSFADIVLCLTGF